MNRTIAIVATVLLISACSDDPEPIRGSGPTPPSCSTDDGRPPAPWIPKDLPIPKGSFTTQDLEKVAGFHRTLLVTPLSLDELARFIIERWAAAGWILGPGDTERGKEIEDTFRKQKRSGVFIGYVHCDPQRSVLQLIYRAGGRALPLPEMGGQGVPLVPTATPTG